MYVCALQLTRVVLKKEQTANPAVYSHITLHSLYIPVSVLCNREIDFFFKLCVSL